MGKPKISVVLPVHNAETTIGRASESILSQSFRDFELLIIPNGITDSTIQLLEGMDDTRVRIIPLPEANLVHALNIGIKNAQADIIARMDADDISLPHRLEQQYSYLCTHKDIGLVSGLVKYVGDQEANEGYLHYVDWANSIITSEEIYLNRFKESALPHPSVMFRKSLINLYGGYSDSVPEDFELWNRWLSHGVKMAKINEVVLDWYDSPGRLSRVNPNYDHELFAQVKAKYFADWYNQEFEMNGPEIYIFGYSKEIRRRTAYLEMYGLKIVSFIDVNRTNSPNTIYYKDLEEIKTPFVLSYVSNRDAVAEIKDYLNQIGLKEGQQFYMMA